MRVYALAAALAAALLSLTLAAGAAGATRPLASLGPLRPAPSPGRPGPELVPVPAAPPLAPPASRATYTRAVDGIRCERNERVAFHIHVHLTVFVRGRARAIPAGVGVWPRLEPQSGKFGQFSITRGECLSWLITRYDDGLLHVEAPVRRSFDLGQFFDVWGQPLGRRRVGPARGQVTAIVDGRVWVGNPRLIPLRSHAQIQLEVGRPLVAPERIRFPHGF